MAKTFIFPCLKTTKIIINYFYYKKINNNITPILGEKKNDFSSYLVGLISNHDELSKLKSVANHTWKKETYTLLLMYIIKKFVNFYKECLSLI